MERLTKKMTGKDGKEKYVIKAEFLSNPSEYTGKIINRLGEYEELDESGLLIGSRVFSEVEFARVLVEEVNLAPSRLISAFVAATILTAPSL